MTEGPRQRLEAGLRLQQSGETEKALACYEEAAAAAREPALLSEALRRQSSAHRMLAQWDVAIELARRAAQVASEANLHDEFAAARNTEATVHQARGDWDAAEQAFEEVLGVTPNLKIRGNALGNLGSIAAQRKDWPKARRRFLQAAKCFQRAGHTQGEASTLNNYGRAALDHGNYPLAARMLSQAIAVAKRVEDLDLVAVATMNHAEAIAGINDLAKAEELAHASLGYFVIAGNTWRRSECLRLLGDIALKRGEPAEARRHYEEGLALAEHIGAAVELTLLRERLAALAGGGRGAGGAASGTAG